MKNYKNLAICFVHGPSSQFNEREYFKDNFRTSLLEKDDISIMKVSFTFE